MEWKEEDGEEYKKENKENICITGWGGCEILCVLAYSHRAYCRSDVWIPKTIKSYSDLLFSFVYY